MSATHITNVFALTGLTDARWQLFAAADDSPGPPTISDPVVSSFSRLVDHRVPCLWRWDQSASSPPPSSSSSSSSAVPGGGIAAVGGGTASVSSSVPPTPPSSIAAPVVMVVVPSASADAEMACVDTVLSSPPGAFVSPPPQPPPPPPPLPPPYRRRPCRELMVFTWPSLASEVPDVRSLIDPSLQLIDEGSWDTKASRPLTDALFSALHNSLERAMHRHAFLRVGSCFVRRCSDTAAAPTPREMVSASFSFFLCHTTVCLHSLVQRKRLWPASHADAAQQPCAMPRGSVVTAIAGIPGNIRGLSERSGASDQAHWEAVHHISPPLRALGFPSLSPAAASVRVGIGGAVHSFPAECVLVHRPPPANAVTQIRQLAGQFVPSSSRDSVFSPSASLPAPPIHHDASAVPDFWNYTPPLLVAVIALPAEQFTMQGGLAGDTSPATGSRTTPFSTSPPQLSPATGLARRVGESLTPHGATPTTSAPTPRRRPPLGGGLREELQKSVDMAFVPATVPMPRIANSLSPPPPPQQQHQPGHAVQLQAMVPSSSPLRRFEVQPSTKIPVVSLGKVDAKPDAQKLQPTRSSVDDLGRDFDLSDLNSWSAKLPGPATTATTTETMAPSIPVAPQPAAPAPAPSHAVAAPQKSTNSVFFKSKRPIFVVPPPPQQVAVKHEPKNAEPHPMAVETQVSIGATYTPYMADVREAYGQRIPQYASPRVFQQVPESSGPSAFQSEDESDSDADQADAISAATPTTSGLPVPASSAPSTPLPTSAAEIELSAVLQEVNSSAEIALLMSSTPAEQDLEPPHVSAPDLLRPAEVTGRDEVLEVLFSLAVHSHEDEALDAMMRARLARAQAAAPREPLFFGMDVPQFSSIEEPRTDAIRAELDPLASEASPETALAVLGEVSPILRDAFVAASGALSTAHLCQQDTVGVEEPAQPLLVAGYRGDWVEFPATWVAHWDKVHLEPYAMPKHVRYYVLCPENQSLELRPFFRDLSVAYEMSNLGRHRPALDFPGSADGFVLVPAGSSADSSSEAAHENHLRQFVAKAEALGAHLADVSSRAYQENSCIAVYYLNPFTRSSPVDTLCDVALCMVALASRTAELPVVQHSVPILEALRTGPNTAPLLRDISLAVYSKLRRLHFGRQPFLLERPQAQASKPPQPLLYEPSCIVSTLPPPGGPAFTQFAQQRLAHVCYAWSDDGQWLVSVLTDSAGELLETFAEPAEAALYGTLHSCFAKWFDVLRSTSQVEWTMVLVKLGVMTQAELDNWGYVFAERSDQVLSDVALSAIRFVPAMQMMSLSPAAAAAAPSPSSSPAVPATGDWRVEVTSKGSTLFFPAAPPLYSLDLHCSPPVASAFISSPAAGSSLWPVSYMLSVFLHNSMLGGQLPPPIELVRVVARQLNALSWLTASPLAPQRQSVLPFHVAIAKRLSRLVTVAPRLIREVAALREASSAALLTATPSSTRTPFPS